MDHRCMVFKTHLAFRNHIGIRVTIRMGNLVICLESVQTAPLGVSPEGIFARACLFFVLTEEVARQAEETLRASAL